MQRMSFVRTDLIPIIVVAISLLTTGGGAIAAQAETGPCPPAASGPSSPVPAASPAAGTITASDVPEMSVRFGETDALLWRAGAYGVVLAHGAAYDAASWRPQAEAIAAAGTTVLALEQTSPADIVAGIAFLTDECGIADIALIGASAGAGSVLAVAADEPDAFDQLIILSATGEAAGLGEQPKLFVASEGEGLAEATRRMADEAPGADNEALILPGDAHAQAIFETEQGDELLQAILGRVAPPLPDAD